MSNGFFSSTEIQGHSVLLALCQLRRQRPWMSQTAGGEADHSGSGPSAWLLSVTSSCCMLFGAQFVWRQKNNTHGKALLLVAEKRKNLISIKYLTRVENQDRKAKRWFLHRFTAGRKPRPQRQRKTALEGLSCTNCPQCRNLHRHTMLLGR